MGVVGGGERKRTKKKKKSPEKSDAFAKPAPHVHAKLVSFYDPVPLRYLSPFGLTSVYDTAHWPP